MYKPDYCTQTKHLTLNKSVRRECNIYRSLLVNALAELRLLVTTIH